jgi:hypothetical protein
VDVGKDWWKGNRRKQFTLQPDNFVKKRREGERETEREGNSVIREFPLYMVRQPSKHEQPTSLNFG